MGNQFIMPGKIVYGEGALQNAKPLLKSFGKKALIVTDRFMTRLGNVKLVTDILDELSIKYCVFDGVNSCSTEHIKTQMVFCREWRSRLSIRSVLLLTQRCPPDTRTPDAPKIN